MPATRATVGSINVLLAVQFGQATAGLSNFAGTVEKTGVRTQRAVSGIDRTVSGLNRSIGSINGRGFSVLAIGALRAKQSLDQMRGILLATSALFGGLVPAALGASLVRVADRAHLLSNNLKTVTKDADDLKATQEALFAVSQRTRSGFEATSTIYARTARATEGLNVSQAKLLRLTETIQKSFAVGGATTQEAQGAAIQLSQGIASNRFSGDEFRSVAENAPVLLRGMAQSLGVSIGKLREMAHAGELTAATVVGAIVDASQRIDEEFAKTTSTIGQAFVQVDNALLKYVGDSDKATVASNAIVTVLQALASNIDTVASALTLLGAAFGAKLLGGGINRLTATAGNLRAMRIEALAAAKANETLAIAEMKTARGDMLARRLAFNRALSEGALTAKQLERQQKAVAASVVTYNAAVQKAAASTVQLGEAQAAVSARSVAMSAAGRAASSAWAFIGGGWGAAILGATVVMAALSHEAQQSAERTDRYSEAIQRAKEDTDGTSGSLQRTAEQFFKIAEGATAAERAVQQSQAANDLKMTLQDLVSAYSSTIWNFSALVDGTYSEMGRLVKAFMDGQMSSEEFKEALDRLAATHPDLAPTIAEMQRLGDQADAERGRIDALSDSLERLQKSAFAAMEAAAGLKNLGVGEKGDKPEHILTKDEFNSRFGQPYAKDWKTLFPGYFKPQKQSRAPRKTADDRFANDVQGIRDRIAAMKEEQSAIGMNFREQQRRKIALELEQTALKQVREEARKKGQQDWQNAQLSPKQEQEIKDVSAAYAAQADELRRVQEAYDLNKDVLKGIFTDLRSALADGKLSWEELGDVALNVLDKIINKIEDQLIDAILEASSAGGSSGGSGSILGWAVKGVGSLLGFSFHGGGTVGSGGNVAQFPHGAPYVGKFHGGGNFGGQRAKHDEVMALVQKQENIFTSDQTDRIIGTLQTNMGSMKERPSAQEVVVRGVFVDDNGVIKGRIERTSSAAVQSGLSHYDKGMPGRISDVMERHG
jgi:tape measure domain-containing protein